MIIILPNERYGLKTILRNFNITVLWNFMSENLYVKGRIVIPAFELHSSFDLVKVLQNLNIKDLFDHKTADFSGMVEGTQQTCVTKVLHQAIIKVTETGTKAVAATTIHKNYMSKIFNDIKFEFIARSPIFVFNY
uniref:Serpin domain-containing protein n=1 Tax=Panagrolaimus sp. PS1159 TaxID=55785 RepID=A0AC35GQB9_9BILA